MVNPDCCIEVRWENLRLLADLGFPALMNPDGSLHGIRFFSMADRELAAPGDWINPGRYERIMRPVPRHERRRLSVPPEERQ